MKVGVQHFGELSDTIASMALHDGSRNRRIDAVLNNYKEISIKAVESVTRGRENYQLTGELSGGQKIHGWDKLITQQKCKICVNEFPSNS